MGLSVSIASCTRKLKVCFLTLHELAMREESPVRSTDNGPVKKFTGFLRFLLKTFFINVLRVSTTTTTLQTATSEYNLYDVGFFEYKISTTVTSTPHIVDQWIFETQLIHHPVIVGLDVEWLPNRIKNSNNPVATLQLCVGHRCLIFQILHSPIIPYSLANFLGNPSYIFTGVGIKDDVKKLREDYHLVVARTKDLRSLAAAKLHVRELSNAGIKRLTNWVLRREIDKPKKITLSGWDSEWLTLAQVQYACLDAFLSFEIARVLMEL